MSAVTVAQIVAVVAAVTDVTEAQILGDQRQTPIVRARWMAMLLAAEEGGASLPAIGRAMASRDHSSVHYAVEAARALIASEEEYAADVLTARALVRRLTQVGVLRLIRAVDPVEVARIVMAAPERQAVACSTREITAMAAWIVSMAGPDDATPETILPTPLSLPIIQEATYG